MLKLKLKYKGFIKTTLQVKFKCIDCAFKMSTIVGGDLFLPLT